MQIEFGKFGEGYLESYAEIPELPVEDPYIAVKKLEGHLRIFDPGDKQGRDTWYSSNYQAPCLAYGEETVNNFLQNMGMTVPGE